MREDKRGKKQEEQLFFQDELPEEILKELTPEVLKQYYLWDEITKREVQLHPKMVLPLIEEVFGKKYPENERIELLSTEYAVKRIHENGEKMLQSVFSDLVIKIGKELYHLECQMNETGDMVLRMLEYDMHIALLHRERDGENMSSKGKNSFSLTLPKSVILYLGNSGNTPEYEECILRFQDGGFYPYKVPVMKVQQYSPQMIEEKHLNMLIPFLPIRFRKALKSKSKQTRNQTQKNLTELLTECIIILNHERENGILTEEERNDIVEFLACACDHLYGGDAELIKEVHEIMEPIVWLRREVEQINRELTSNIQNLQKDNKDLQENNKNLQKDNKDLQENNKNLQKDNRNLQTKIEDSQIKLIYKLKQDGKSQQEAMDTLKELFSLGEEEAKEKVMLNWRV